MRSNGPSVRLRLPCSSATAARRAASRSPSGRGSRSTRVTRTGIERLRVLLAPLPARTLEAEAERVVMPDHRLGRPLQPVDVDGLAGNEEERLVPVMEFGQLLLEEPALDRRERERPAQELLLRGSAGGPGESEASPAIVGCWKNCFGVIANPAWRARLITWMLRIESPPSLKKLSSTPTSSRRSTSFQICVRACSAGLRGETAALAASRATTGRGSALRSTLPCAVRGSASRTAKAAGTM